MDPIISDDSPAIPPTSYSPATGLTIAEEGHLQRVTFRGIAQKYHIYTISTQTVGTATTWIIRKTRGQKPTHIMATEQRQEELGLTFPLFSSLGFLIDCTFAGLQL
ncbi:hypothetical protein ACJX0J_026755 [Zea mays]